MPTNVYVKIAASCTAACIFQTLLIMIGTAEAPGLRLTRGISGYDNANDVWWTHRRTIWTDICTLNRRRLLDPATSSRHSSVEAELDSLSSLAWLDVLPTPKSFPRLTSAGRGEAVWFEATGLPFRCAYWELRRKDAAARDQEARRTGIALTNNGVGGEFGNSKILPTCFVIVPTALNIVVTALPLFASWCSMEFYVRRRRRQSSRCIRCGYPRSGLLNRTSCPECGMEVNLGATRTK